MKIRTLGKVLVILGAVIGAILIVSGALLAVMSPSTSIETVNEIQIDVQNHYGTYYGTYYFGAQKDIILVNVNTSESDTLLNLMQRDWNRIIYLGGANWTHHVAGADGPQFLLNASLPSDGDYWVEISADSGVVSAIGTITQTHTITYYSYLYDSGVKILLFGSFLASGSLFIYGYRQVKLELKKTRGILSGRFLASLEPMSIYGGFLFTLISGVLPPLQSIARSILEPPHHILLPIFHWTIQRGFPLAWLYGKWTYGTFRGYFFVWQGFIVDFLFWGLLTAAITYLYVRRKRAHLPNTE